MHRCLPVFRSRVQVVVVNVLQPGPSRILGIMSHPQSGPAGHAHTAMATGTGMTMRAGQV
jgi:hypothetical protein